MPDSQALDITPILCNTTFLIKRYWKQKICVAVLKNL